MLIVFSVVGVAFWSGCGNTAEPSKPPYVSVFSDCCGDIKAKKQVLNHRSVYYGGGDSHSGLGKAAVICI